MVRIDRPTIYHIDVYDEMIQDFWSECRSGFANSTWTVVPRPEGERAGPTDWVRLYLPFEWAEEVEINIGTVQSDLSLLALRHRATGQRLSIAVTEHTWIATVPNMAPGSDPLPFSPPAPEEWTAIGSTPPDETERYVESLTGPNGFELLPPPQ